MSCSRDITAVCKQLALWSQVQANKKILNENKENHFPIILKKNIWQSFPVQNILEFNAFPLEKVWSKLVASIATGSALFIPLTVSDLTRWSLWLEPSWDQTAGASEKKGPLQRPLKNMPFNYFCKCKWTSEWKLCGVQPSSAGDRGCYFVDGVGDITHITGLTGRAGGGLDQHVSVNTSTDLDCPAGLNSLTFQCVSCRGVCIGYLTEIS